MKDHFKAVIWDMGGVILRTEDPKPRCLLAKQYGITPDDLYRLVFNSRSASEATIGAIDEKEHWDTIGSHFSLSSNELKIFQDSFWAGDKLDQRLIRFIKSLYPAYVTGLLSNAWSGARKALNQKHSCDEIFTFSLFSFEAGLAKPDPLIYFKLLDAMQVRADEAIFVDDVLENVQTANQVGIRGIQFFDTTQAIDAVKKLLDL
jgi:HAD superfamily hydrolase (TIGR01509 family)